MSKLIDLTGLRFGKLVVIERFYNGYSKAWWKVRCDCGQFNSIAASNLKRKIRPVQSCGCMKGNRKKEITLPMLFPKEYQTWHSIKSRTLYMNPNHKQYKDYKGRGIKIFEGWKNNFAAFLDHIGQCPDPKLTIGRINNDGNYEPGNVEWQNRSTQQRNMRGNRLLTCNGVTKTVVEWSEQVGVEQHIISHRLARGKSVYESIFEPVIKRK